MDTSSSMPHVPGLKDKIATLKRRLGHLEKRINESGRTGPTRDFDRAEASAVRAGIQCMEYVGELRGGAS
jgi:hypothetical protein